MNPLSQSRMNTPGVFDSFKRGWTGGRPFPFLPMSPSSLIRAVHLSRADFFLSPSLFFSLSPLSPSRLRLLFFPSRSSTPPAPYFYHVRSLFNASVTLNVGLQLEMRIPASEQWRVKKSGTQWDRTKHLYKSKSLRSPNWGYSDWYE